MLPAAFLAWWTTMTARPWQRYSSRRNASDTFTKAARNAMENIWSPLSRQPGAVLAAALSVLVMVGGMASLTTTATAGETFKDCTDCPEMVVIPAGNFEMGSPSSEAGRVDAEGPLHRVNIAAFALAKTHVTRGQFAAFVDETGYEAGDSCYTFEGGEWKSRQGRNWRNPGYGQEDSHPAVCLSWKDAKAYVEWLTRKTGKQYRLPTEAEWEYAARAGTTTARYWGESPDQACGYANVMDTTGKARVPGVTWEVHNCSDGYAYTAPAASFKPNAFGLNDMIGNAWEWVEDCFNYDYIGAPTDGSAWRAGRCTFRVLRGGSWNVQPAYARSAKRFTFKAAFRYFSSGVRPVRVLP